MALEWTEMAGAGDWTAVQLKPQCLQLVPGWCLSQGWSQGFPEAATPLQSQVWGALLLKAGSVSSQPAWLGWLPQVSSNFSLNPPRAASAL